MRKKWLDYSIFEAVREGDVTADLLNDVDILFIPEKITTGIYASQYIRWIGALQDYRSWKNFIPSEHLIKELISGEKKLTSHGYSITITPLTEKSAREFITLYQNEVVVAKGSRWKSIDVNEQTIGKLKAGLEVYLIGVYEASRLCAGLVFYKKGSEVFVTVGAKEKYKKIKGGFGGVIEKYLIDWSITHGISLISHGRSDNPAGLVSGPGLFEFKARYGYSAYPEGMWRSFLLLSDSAVDNDLLFVSIGPKGLSTVVAVKDPGTFSGEKYKTRQASELKPIYQSELIEKSRAWVSERAKKRLI